MQNQLTRMPDSMPLPALREPEAEEAELFKRCLQPLKTVCRPPLDAEQVLGYFNALAELPPEAVFAAASEIAASRQYPTWPMPGEIRAVAARILSPQLSAGEAWRIAQVAARLFADESLDFHNGRPPSEFNDEVWGRLPSAVAVTLRIFGGRKIGNTQAIYANFRDEYERQVTIMRRPLMLPIGAKQAMAQLDQARAQAVAKIGSDVA